MAASGGTSAVTDEQVAWYCCGSPMDASNLVRFDRNPQDGVCTGCAGWLYKRGQASVHEIRPPFWWRLTRKRFHST